MNKELYPSDITREQFSEISSILESAKNKTSPRTLDLYDVFNAILYILKTGCQWRSLPKDYPDYRRVHYYFLIWRDGKILEKVLKKISWQGPNKKWSESKNEFHNN
jgi:transposase